jgi:hypothetical protein
MNTTHQTMPAIRKIARIEDKATTQFLEEIEFPISSTEVRRIQLAPSVVNDPTRFENFLLDRGASLPHDAQARKTLLADVANSEAPETFVYHAQGGWTEPPGTTFVLPDGAISVENTNIIGVSPSYAMDDPRGRRKTSGSLTSWRDTVGQTALLSSLFMFTISVAFAAPLLAMGAAC